MRIEVRVEIQLVEGDVVFLASDGPIGMMNEEEYIRLIRVKIKERVKSFLDKLKNDSSLIQDDSTLMLYKHR